MQSNLNEFSSNVVKDLKAKVTLIETATMYRKDLDADRSEGGEPPSWRLPDHKVVILELKSGYRLKTRKFVIVVSHISWHHPQLGQQAADVKKVVTTLRASRVCDAEVNKL